MDYSFLIQIPQWIFWKSIPVEGKKPRKVPCDALGGHIDPHNPAFHMSYQVAYDTAVASEGTLLLGFVVTGNDPILFLDLDNCINPDGSYTLAAQMLLAMVPGALIERSVSGTGLHALFSWNGVMPQHSKRNADMNAEFYSEKRFLALGHGIQGDVSTVIDPTALINQWFPPRDENLVEWRETPVPEWNGHADDNILITDACKPRTNDAATVFGGESQFASFKGMWTRDVVELSRCFPGDGDYGVDWSKPDYHLAKQLAYQTGNNHARIEHLMWQSALVRPKWTEHPSYLKKFTITQAVNDNKQVRGEKKQSAELPTPGVIDSTPVTHEPRETSGAQLIIGPEDLKKYFAGCVYIAESDRVLMPNGVIMKPATFKNKMGGYDFTMNAENTKVVDDAFKCFMLNQTVRFPQADTSCFRPDLPFSTFVDEDGGTAVNIYKKPNVDMIEGDWSPVLNLLQALWPKDWEELWSYFCACVQYPGVKFRWLPLMQGPQGCGKGVFLKLLAYAVGGPSRRYVHTLDPGDITNNFNGYMVTSTVVMIDEIKVGNKWDMIEKMKSMVTEEFLQVTFKGVDSVSKRQIANFVACTNHRTGVPIQPDDRRWGMFWTEPQDYEDLLALGLTDDYYIRLHKWLEEENGYQIVAHAMATYQIKDKMNPAKGSTRAPHTSSRDEAVDENMGKVEQLILEAIDTGGPGFMDGMTSSISISRHLMGHGVELPTSKFVEIMRVLGYVRLPALKNNKYKVNNSFIGEAPGVPVLYAIKHHPILQEPKASDVRSYYINAQGYDKLVGVPNG